MKKALQFLKECQKDINDFIDSFDECSCDEDLHNAKITKLKINEAIKELEDLQSRSCENCKFNSSKIKNDELITCDLNKEFTNQRKIIFCGKWESK